jgi:hypothetical protein
MTKDQGMYRLMRAPIKQEAESRPLALGSIPRPVGSMEHRSWTECTARAVKFLKHCCAIATRSGHGIYFR